MMLLYKICNKPGQGERALSRVSYYGNIDNFKADRSSASPVPTEPLTYPNMISGNNTKL